MAAITSEENDPQPLISPTPGHGDTTPANQTRRAGIRPLHKQLAGAAAVLVVFIACLAVWGPGMGFRTTYSTSQVATTGTGTLTLERTYRDISSDAINDAVDWLTREGSWLFGGLETAVTYALSYIETGLAWLPWPAVVLGLALLSFVVGRWPLAVFTCLALLFAGFMGLWGNMMDTIALMAVAVALSVGIGFPLGVLGARNQMVNSFMRPVLDGMQTMPSFVYLLPGILFFGLGKPAGIFATIIYAVPPVIRLTNLGIRQVSPETVEAARSFGASPLQLLVKVQVPMALPTIMAGINQTTMMALAMVTIASLVAAGGLGDNVLRALQKNDSGTGAIAGLTIVFLAIIIDRLTQAAARRQQQAIDEGH